MRTGASAAFVFALVLSAPATASALDQREYIDDFVQIPEGVYDVVTTVFPESGSIGAAYLSDSYSPNLVVTEDANVMVTFVHEGAGYRNTLGYFTYSTDGSEVVVQDAQLVFPNASHADPNKGWGGGQLVPGDTVTLRDADGTQRVFHQGERIGFFLVANGWDGGQNRVRGWSPETRNLPFTDPADNALVANGVFTTLDELNPEVSTGNHDIAKHVAMVRVDALSGFLDEEDFFLTGFEDQRRDGHSDDDFNDVVVIVHANPPTALDATNVQQFDDDDPDPDGDGVEGLEDMFPEDPDRAFVVRTPPSGYQSLVFEDSYPSVGDGDYNDVVVQFAIEEVLSASGELKELSTTWHLIARGARFDHRFGLSIPNIPEAATGFVRVERFSSEGDHTSPQSEALGSFLRYDIDGLPTLRLDHVFPSTMAALPAASETENYSNTLTPVPGRPPASSRLIVTFDALVERAPLGPVPFDPFIQVVREDGLYDIHLPGKQPFPDRPEGLRDESAAFTTFIDDNYYPWAMLVPYDWRYPLESVFIEAAYGSFGSWRSSLGQLSTDWYKTPSGSVIDPIGDASRARPWTLRLGE